MKAASARRADSRRRQNARDAMSPGPIRITPDRTIREAARVMIDAGISSVLVEPLDRNEPFGILTAHDVVDVVASGRDPDEATVRDAANQPLLIVTPGVPLSYAARAMSRFGLRHLAVFNGREVVGILSHRDIVRAVADGNCRGE
jgi:CBS domain-containing protein